MNAANLADAAVGQRLAQRIEPAAVHEHHPVHELHARLIAGGELGLRLGHIDAARLLAHYMLARLRRFNHPLRAHPGGERNVHRINVIAGEQGIVALHRLRLVWKRHVRRTLINPPLRFGGIATGHRDNLAIAG